MSIRQGRPEDYSKGPYLIVLDVAPCARSHPFHPPHHPSLPPRHRMAKPDQRVLTRVCFALFLVALRFLRPVSSSSSFPIPKKHVWLMQPFSVCSPICSRCRAFRAASDSFSRKLCNAFYLFTKANTHLRRMSAADTRSHLVAAIETRKREKVLQAGRIAALKRNATIPLMEFL